MKSDLPAVAKQVRGTSRFRNCLLTPSEMSFNRRVADGPEELKRRPFFVGESWSS